MEFSEIFLFNVNSIEQAMLPLLNVLMCPYVLYCIVSYIAIIGPWFIKQDSQVNLPVYDVERQRGVAVIAM